MTDSGGFQVNSQQSNQHSLLRNIVPCVTSMLKDNELQQRFKLEHLSNTTISLVGQIIDVSNNGSNTLSTVVLDDGYGKVRINCLKNVDSSHTELLKDIIIINKPYVKAIVKISPYQNNNLYTCILNGLRFTELNSHDLIIYHYLSVTKAIMIQRRIWKDSLSLEEDYQKNNNKHQDSNQNGQQKSFNLADVCTDVVKKIRTHDIQNLEEDNFNQLFDFKLSQDHVQKTISKLVREGIIYQVPGTNKYCVNDEQLNQL